MMKSVTLADLASHIGASVRGDASYQVNRLATLASATAEQVSFLANEKYRSQLADTGAGAVIMHPDADDGRARNALLTTNPYLGYAKVAQLLDTSPKRAQDIHPTAVISAQANLGKNVAVGAHAVIESGAHIADNVVIGAQCFVGENVEIGEGSRLFPQVTLYHNVVLGKGCTVHSSSTIGADGFGWATENGKWVKIPQLGRVIVGDNVDIGANSSIDRGALDDTIIGSGCIIDNLVQIGHNVVLGEGTAIAGQAGIAGSTRIGKNCLIGGQAGLGGHIEIADNVQLHGQAMVTKSIDKAGVYASGNPVAPQGEWAKTGVRYRQLPDLFKRVKALETKLNIKDQ
ncbi:UDP-3-O-(3-hydroxymyristoyl)glucosamine N-acyltransferase [Aliidiomarina minuta]|uniref:UDP-3-O-acylglucosamine N-acyltransferase n=1 Tax=Aliidiomarina minuta TaxID=880057 RepID=A0A432W5R3_9GAMM|nr:UDP-3-O-(3-hydroxymyristoyl)glucosamine N-acyltransferase [Aliidiomarina minuta]RUO25418.1 UDP-3-O-(3-hydroxymyristoyl)glucosamine N-acyltransferase [Aliidiomarina minuta]